MHWLRLIRWKNLLIVFFTQLLVWQCLIVGHSPARVVVLHWLNFGMLTGSTLLIAAAGYIINDYFDIRTDTINRPDRVVVTRLIPGRWAIVAHTALNAAALAMAAAVAVPAHHASWLLLQLCCTLLLWFYSTHFKRQYITGNVVVSLLTALTIITVWVYEPGARNGTAPMPLASQPAWAIAFYAFFAFMLTWIREIVKDMEDYLGDEAAGCNTMPIQRGFTYSARFAIVLAALVLAVLVGAIALLALQHGMLLALWLAGMVLSPLACWCVYFIRGHGVAHYHRCSTWLKLVMVSGISSLLIFYIQFP